MDSPGNRANVGCDLPPFEAHDPAIAVASYFGDDVFAFGVSVQFQGCDLVRPEDVTSPSQAPHLGMSESFSYQVWYSEPYNRMDLMDLLLKKLQRTNNWTF